MRDRVFKYLISAFLLLAPNLFAFEILSVRSKGLGSTFQLSNSDAASFVNSGLSFGDNKYGVEFGYIRNYELSDLDEYMVAGFYKSNNFTTSIGISQFGNPELYTEQNYKLTLSYALNYFRMALNGSVRIYNFDTEFESLSAQNYGFSFGYQHKHFLIGLVFDDLAKPELTDKSGTLPHSISLHFELVSSTRYRTYISYDIFADFDNCIGIGEEIQISNSFSLLTGFRSDPTTLSGGFQLRIDNQWMTYVAVHHPVLGLTHGISITFVQ